MEMPVFGDSEASRDWVQRRGAYALVLDGENFAAVEPRPGVYFLPGGGVKPGETTERALAREVKEELGWSIRDIRPTGRAVQHFSVRGIHYRLVASFFRVLQSDGCEAGAEFDLRWLPVGESDRLFHECHGWAVKMVAGANQAPREQEA